MSIPQTPSPLSNIIAAKTYNAGWFSGSTKEAQITAAIAAAVLDGALYVYVPANMLPYNASAVTFNANVKMLREGGGSSAALDIQAYGADPLGVLDCTPCFTAAMLALPLGGEINVPGGLYKPGSTITVSIANITFTGTGMATVIRPSTATFNLFTLLITAHRTKFHKIWFQGAAVDSSTQQYAIYTNAFAAPDQVEIVSCFLGSLTLAGGSLNDGIKIDGGNDWIVHDTFFRYFYLDISLTGYAILAGTTNKLHVYDCNFLGNIAGLRGRHAVYLSSGCTNCDIHDNVVEAYLEEAFPLYARGNQAANTDNHIHHNTVIGGGELTATSAAFSIFGLAQRNKISHNKTIGFQGFGITINRSGEGFSPCADNTIEDNEIDTCAWAGIGLIGATNTTIKGNKVNQCSTASPGTYAAITIQADLVGGTNYSAKTTVQANKCYGTNLRAGLNILEAGNTGTVVLANHMPDGQVSKMIFNGAPCRAFGNDFGLPEVSGNNGDASVNLMNGAFDSDIQTFASALTVNRTVTLSLVYAYEGKRIRVVRTGLGAGTLDVGPGLKLMPAATAADTEVAYNGTAWVLIGYGTL